MDTTKISSENVFAGTTAKQGLKMGTTESKNYNAIDLMKFLAAMLVISAHTSLFSSYSNILSYITNDVVARIAVPFFFITSGFLFFRKIEFPIHGNPQNLIRLKRYMMRIISLYIIWSLFYLPLGARNVMEDHSSKLLVLALCIRNFIFSGVYYHLWYFSALIFAIIVAYLFLKHFSLKTALITSFVFYIIGTLDETYYGLVRYTFLNDTIIRFYSKIFLTTRNGLFFGAIFIFLGVAVAKGKITFNIAKIKLYLSISLLFFLVEVSLLYYFKLQKDYNMYLGVIPLSLFLFLLLIRINLKDSPIYKFMRNVSTILYGVHPIFLHMLKSISCFFFPIMFENSLLRFTIVSFLSLIFSYFIILLSKHKKLSFLKVLI